MEGCTLFGLITTGIQLRADKHFYRLHEAFGDAVRSQELSAIAEVLVCAGLSGDRARRTAEKILADRRLRESK